MWLPAQIADVASAALKQRTHALRLEQAVRGLDALEEVEFHPLLAVAFEQEGFGVIREAPYPGEPARRPKHGERERCDLVLTPAPAVHLRDPVAELKRRDAAAGTLFEPMADALSVAPGIDPEEAFWLEVKLVGQFCYSAGVPGPNRAYASELLTITATDIPKLARDARIHHAGLLVILFTEDQRTADHDLGVFAHRCLDRGLSISMPACARFEVPDIIGNKLCTVCVIGIAPGTCTESTPQ